MGHMEKKIFFFDIDGTLYDEKLGTFPPSTQDALRQLFARGHRMFIATSRSCEEMENVRKLINQFPFCGFLYVDGASVQCGEARSSTEFIPPKAALDIMAFCQREKILVRWQAADKLCFNERPTERITREMEQMFGYIPPVQAWEGEPLLRIAIYAPVDVMAPLCRNMPEIFCSALSLRMSAITRSGVEKGSAMRAQVEREGMTLSDTIAFGDSFVDQGMLRLAGVGIAMGGSPECVKACADYVTAPITQGGILQACRNFGWI